MSCALLRLCRTASKDLGLSVAGALDDFGDGVAPKSEVDDLGACEDVGSAV
jgi:hypothetical protein